jgi:hypothetical protein
MKKLSLLLLAPLAWAQSADEAAITKLYETRDIASRIGALLPMPVLGVPQKLREKTESGEQSPTAVADDDTGTKQQLESGIRRLEELLRRHAGLSAETLASPKRLRMTEAGTLVAETSASEQARLARVVENLRRFEGAFSVEALLVEVPRDVTQDLGLNESSVLQAEVERDALLASLRNRGASVVVGPKLLVNPLQRANVIVGDTLNYIGDWSVHTVEPGPVEVLDPVLMEVTLGSALAAFVAPLPESKVALSLEVQHASAERPLRTQRVSRAGREVEVALPVITQQRAQLEFSLADGATAVLALPAESERVLLQFVTVRSVPQQK